MKDFSGDKITYHADGSIQTAASYVNGELHGSFVSFHANGKKKSQCFYQHNKKHGTEIEFDSDGEIKKIANYENGHLKGYQYYRDTTVRHAWHDGTDKHTNIIRFL